MYMRKESEVEKAEKRTEKMNSTKKKNSCLDTFFLHYPMYMMYIHVVCRFWV